MLKCTNTLDNRANWDPYGNTGNVAIAIASDDKGYSERDLSQEAIETITESKSIKWVVMNSGDEFECDAMRRANRPYSDVLVFDGGEIR